MSISKRQAVLGIIAIFVMFLPRNLSIAGMFSFRIFIISAALLAFLLLGVGIKLSGLIRKPLFWAYLGIVSAVQFAHREYTTLLGNILDILVLYVVLYSCLRSKNDMEFFIRIFLAVLILYSSICIIETLTGINPWTLLGVKVKTYNRYGLYRAFGSFTTSINNGSFLMLTFPLSWYAQRYFTDKRLSKVAIIFTWIALICTLSRGPIIGALLLNIIIVWKSGLLRFFKRNLLKVILALLIFSALMFIPAVRSATKSFFDMFFAIFDSSVADEISGDFGGNADGIGHRFMLYSWVWEDLSGNYWFGKGALTPLHHLWMTSRGTLAIKQSIENFYLSTLYHYGITGLLALIAFLIEESVSLFGKYRAERKESNLKIASDSWQFRIFVTVLCYFGVLFTVSAVDDFKMFFILLALSDAWRSISLAAPADVNSQKRLTHVQNT